VSSNRLPDLVHYIIWSCDPSELGATKLNKICWYADLVALRTYGHTISGAENYMRLQFGPAPKGVHHVLENLQSENKIAITKETYFNKPKTMYMALEHPNLAAFTAEEIAIIDPIATTICSKHTAASISLLSHDDLWQEIELGQEIPIAAAAVIPGEITADDLEWAQRVTAELDADRPAP
jgi:hypothetical protein